MFRIVLPMILLAGAAHAAPAPPAPTTEAMVSRCMTAPELCKTLILSEAAKLEKSRTACIPKDIGPDRAAFRIMETADEVLEEDPDSFKEFDYATLARQLLTFLWPCPDKPIS
jgi:hypothetical protein